MDAAVVSTTASTIVKPVVESLMDRVKKHLSYLISSSKHVEDMRTKMEKLKDIKLGVERDRNNNKANSLEVPMEVEPWLKKVEKIDARVKTFPDDVGSCSNLKVAVKIDAQEVGKIDAQEVGKIDAQVETFPNNDVGCCFILKDRYKLGKEASEIIQDIERLMKEKSEIEWTKNPITPAEVGSTNASTSTPFSDYNDFGSRKSVYSKAFNALKVDGKPHMIALCGMGGIGKTTMMERLEKVVRENTMFDFVIKVAIGEKINVSEFIQNAIAEQLAIDLNVNTKEARVIKLRNGFKGKSEDGKKKFLLILDDIWQSVDLKDIGLSPKPDQGIVFKVLLTSRDRNVCLQGVDPDSIMNLEVIKDSEAQDLFLQFVKIPDDVHETGHAIIIRCHGLPIAISTIARVLIGKKKDVWEDTLSKLKHKKAHEVVGEIFAISYKHIHDEETRLTLLLCGLFPEDFDTPTEDLVRYGFGLKLFRNVESIREARNRLNTCIERLIHANLLIQSQEVGRVKMHDLVREFVLDVCFKGEYSSIVGKWPTEPMNEDCKMISITCTGMHDFPTSCKYPNLLLLKLMHGDESLMFPEDFYEKMKKLEVVAFDKMEYPLQLRSLQCSANLRTLCLHQCSLMLDCSSIGDLLNLEVLSFAYSIIQELPSTIINLKELKLLDLTACKYLFIDDGILKSLVKLEELYMRGVRPKVNDEGDELVECSKNLDALEIEFFDKDVVPQNMSFKNFKRFRISLGCHLDKIDGKSKYSFKNTLMLAIDECELLDYGMNELFKKTEVLYLQVNGINDFGDGLGALLHNLRVLRICKCTNLRYLFTIRVANGLKQLERLEIDECPVLKALVDSDKICEVEVIMFPALKFLSLKRLPMLLNLCKGGNVIELPQLEKLELERLPKITSIYHDFLKKEVMSSKLKELHIFRMENLMEIWPSKLSNNDLQVISSQLRVIQVEGCDSLVNLFPSNPMSLLHHLEDLEVSECGSIDVIFNIDLGSSSCVAEIEEGSSSNLRFVDVWRCEELREVWRVKGVNDNLSIHGFQNVERIKIRDCMSLRNVFTPTTSNFDMKALAKITLHGNVWEKGENPFRWPVPKSKARPYEMVRQVEEINVVAFPSYLIHTCRNIHTLDINLFRTAEVAFEIETPNSRNLTLNNQQQQSLLPHLKDLTVTSMMRMTHVWKYDWNQFLISQQEPISSSFLNLTSITLSYCNGMKCLFSPLMAKFLSNLKSITIYNCDAIEEVVSNIDDEYEEIATSISSHTNTTFFPHLDILALSHLKSLRCIDGVGANRLTSVTATSVDDKFQCSQVGVAYSSFCRYLKTIKIGRCDALLNVIPSHADGEMSKLEVLEISYCHSLREIFEIEGVIIEDVVGDITDIGEGGSSDTGSATTIIPRLTNMTNSLELSNLRVLHVVGCHGLKYIFTISTLESLKKLQVLKIKDCSAIQVIIMKHEDNGLAASKDVVFPRLKSLKLSKLEKLKSFFLGKNNFWWPSLDEVEMYGCPQMMIFTPGPSMAPKLKYISTGVGKHSLECGLNFDWTNSLQHEEIQLYNSRMCSTSDITEYLQFPWSFSNLIELYVTYGHELNEKGTIFPRIDELVKVENVGDIEETVVDKVVFEGTNDETQSNKKPQLFMSSMDHPPTSSLSCIWKINPSNLSNLTKVSLYACHYPEPVFSYGMAASLVKLQDLHISYCNDMKVIVEAVQDYSETNKAKEVVSFPCLKSLQLHFLKSLKGFCLGSDQAFQWPSLHTLKITDCPRMTIFTKGQSTTPKLKVIRTGYGLCEATGDLNSFIRTKIQEGYKF